MSRVLKSSQIIIDKEKFQIISSPKPPTFKNSLNKSSNSYEKDLIVEAKEDSKQMIMSAKNDAEKIINEAYEKSKLIMEKSRLQGYDDGKNLGFKEGKELAGSIVNEALNIKQEVITTKKTMVKDLEEDVMNLTLYTIEKILNKKVDNDYDTILSLIKSGLEKCAFTDNLILRISPQDYDFAVSSKDKILALSENIQDIVIKQDKSLVKGSCIIDTLSGSIDSSISTQINHVKQIFQELLKSE